MKNALSCLSSTELIQQTLRLASDERRITIELIEHLREVDSRMLYAELGYGSLFEFTVKHLGLSEGSAHRRISTMRLVRDVPEAKEKLQSGELTITNAAKIQVAFKAAQNSMPRPADKTISGSHESKYALPNWKSSVVEACIGRSQSQCDEILFQSIPELAQAHPQERVKRVAAEVFEVRLVISDELHEKIQQLNRLISHSNPDQKILNLLERLVNQELKRQEKKRISEDPDSTAGQSETVLSDSFSSAKPIGIPASIKRQVWSRALSRCEFPGCSSRYQLQIDHRTPKALGGTNRLENLRLLCRTHNLYEAKRLLGDEKMDSFLIDR